MRSGKSYFDKTLFKKTVTRWWPVWTAYLVLWLFILPINLMVEHLDYVVEVADSLSALGIFAAIYSPICAAAVMSHLYWQRSANFYGTLPVKREGIFLTQYLAGLCFTLAPNAVVAVLTTVVAAVNGANIVQGILVWYAVSAVATLLFYTIAILCGLFAGHVLAVPVFYVVFNSMAVAGYELLAAIFRDAYYGFAGFPGWVESAALWLTPVVKLSNPDFNLFGPREALRRIVLGKETTLTLVVYLGVAAALFICCYVLYKRRRTESAGDVVAVTWMKPVFKYGVAVCAGLFFGYVTVEVFGLGPLFIWAPIWTVIGYFAAQMTLDKTFRVFSKWRGAVTVCLVIVAAMAIVDFDLTGFEDSIPKAEDVESVEITQMNTAYDLGDSSSWGNFTASKPEQIKSFIDLHKAAVEQHNEPDRMYISSPDGPVDESAYRFGHAHITMTYHLKNHGTMSRQYTIRIYDDEVNTEGTAARALERIFEDRDLTWSMYGMDKLMEFIDNDGVPEMYYRFNDYYADGTEPELEYDFMRNNGYVNIVKYDDIMAIIDAIMRDFNEGTIMVRRVGVEREYSEASRYIDMTIGPVNLREAAVDYARNLTIRVMPESKHTLETILGMLPGILEEQGHLNSEKT